MSDQSLESTSDDLFSFGVAELARAERLNSRPVARVTPLPPPPPPKAKNAGFDPYNSAASAKRKAWTSVRKR